MYATVTFLLAFLYTCTYIIFSNKALDRRTPLFGATGTTVEQLEQSQSGLDSTTNYSGVEASLQQLQRSH